MHMRRNLPNTGRLHGARHRRTGACGSEGHRRREIPPRHHGSEQNAHARNLSELADQLDIAFTPENARDLAKEAVAHYVRRYDEYLLDERGETDAGEQ